MTNGKLAYSPQEAALSLGLCVNSIYKLIREKRLKAVRLNRKILIPRTEIERLLSGNPAPSGGATL